MQKDLNISILLDFYKDLLTDKQFDSLDLYYNQDLSLGEIAVNMEITRQGVRDSIKRGEKQLFELEEKLGLVKKFNKVSDCTDYILHQAETLSMSGLTFDSKKTLDQITSAAKEIKNLL